MAKCRTCGHDLPEAVWVGPGDEVLFTGKQFKVVGKSRRFENMIIVEGFGPYCDPFARAYPDELRTLDGRPVAAFRDPAQETIKEYDAANKHLASDLADARERIAELETKFKEHGWRVGRLSQDRAALRERIKEAVK